MWRQMAFGTRVDAIGHGESRKRSSIGECAKGQLIESELAETSPAQRMGLRAVSQQLRKRVLGRREPSTAPAAERPRKRGQDAAGGGRWGSREGRPGQHKRQAEPDRAVRGCASRRDSTSACLWPQRQPREVGRSGRQAGRRAGGWSGQAGREASTQAERLVGWAGRFVGRAGREVVRAGRKGGW